MKCLIFLVACILIQVQADQFHTVLDLIKNDNSAAIETLTMNVNLVGGCNRSLLHLAAQFNAPKTAEYLISKGANVNYQMSSNSMTPLMYAVENNSPEVLVVLKNHGADRNMRDVKGRTAMDIAKEINHEELIAVF